MALDRIPEYPFERPCVVVSKCLGFENVRYDGGIVHCQIINDIEHLVDFITVCPEVEIGLGVPRETIRIVRTGGEKKLFQPKTKRDVTELMNSFTDDFLKNLNDVDGFIFKSGSPTIGIRNIKIYSAAENSPVIDHGSGFFAEKILNKYAHYPMEEDDRLRNKIIRHHFLTMLFSFADFRKVKMKKSAEKLCQFHKQNCYLFRLYERDIATKMEKIIENITDNSFDTESKNYEKLFHRIFLNHPGTNEYTNLANVIFLSVDDYLNKAEKKYLNKVIQKYADNRLGNETLLEILKLYVIRFSHSKSKYSRLFYPYPEELKTESEADRGRDFWSNFPIPNSEEQSK